MHTPVAVSYTHLELLYRVSYYGARINVEMFHAISDGNGGMVFLKTDVYKRQIFNNAHPSGVCKRQNGLAIARWRGCAPTSSRLR